MNSLDYLLRRYSEGTITPEEQQELDALTHRSQVFQAASHHADQITRRRNASFAAVASLLLIAGGAFLFRPSVNQMVHEPIIAETHIEQANPSTTPTAAPEVIDQEQHRLMAQVEEKQQTIESPVLDDPSDAVPASVEVINEVIHETEAYQTVIACNSQCSPDSVINDIWKFLRA